MLLLCVRLGWCGSKNHAGVSHFIGRRRRFLSLHIPQGKRSSCPHRQGSSTHSRWRRFMVWVRRLFTLKSFSITVTVRLAVVSKPRHCPSWRWRNYGHGYRLTHTQTHILIYTHTQTNTHSRACISAQPCIRVRMNGTARHSISIPWRGIRHAI